MFRFYKAERVVQRIESEGQETEDKKAFHKRAAHSEESVDPAEHEEFFCGVKQFPDKSQHYEHSHHYQRKRSYSQNLL